MFQKKTKVPENGKPFITPKIKRLINKRDKAYRINTIECFKYLRGLISADIRSAKTTFYNEKVRLKRCPCPKSWSKKIIRIRKKKNEATLPNPETGIAINDKQSADYTNSFFTNLTKNYPEVKSEWLINQCSDDLIVVKNVEKSNTQCRY